MNYNSQDAPGKASEKVAVASSTSKVVSWVVHLWGFSYLNISGKETARD